MTTKKRAADQKASTVIVDDPEALKGRLKRIGGSQSDHWNNLIANHTFQTLWVAHSDEETRSRQCSATVAALIGIGPQDEIEGMMASQLLAAHHAAIECYRRAMISDQTFEGRRESLNQANKLSRTYAVLLDALNRHRGKSHQKVTVEHVHVHAGGQAVVGTLEAPGGSGSREIGGSTPCKAHCPCTAAGDVGHAQGAGTSAGHPRCRTAAAGCTAGCHRAPRKVIRTRSSTVDIGPMRLLGGARLARY